MAKPKFKPKAEIVTADGATVLGWATYTRNTYRIALATGENGSSWGPSGADGFMMGAYYGGLRDAAPREDPNRRRYLVESETRWRGAARHILGPAMDAVPTDSYMRDIKKEER